LSSPTCIREENRMDKDESTKLPLLAFWGAAFAPVVTFVLSNACFLPLTLSMMDFSDSFLADLIPSNIPGSGYLFVAALVVLFPLAAAAVLVSPALTSFIVNLIHPISTNWSRAIWSGVVFFFCNLILLIILLVFRGLPVFPTPQANFPFPSPVIDPLAILGFLGGFVLSCSVTIFGWLGAYKKRKKA
jgi:hypothetical protein